MLGGDVNTGAAHRTVSIDMEPVRPDLEPARTHTNHELDGERALTDVALDQINRPRDPRAVRDVDLRDERAKTDAGLLSERAQTDEVVDDVSVLLVDERAAHALSRTAVARRDDLLALVSHELRNPLGAIVLNAHALLELPPAFLTPSEIRNLAEDIKSSGAQMTRLVGDLLDVASMEAGRIKVTLAKADVSQVLHDATLASRPAIQQASLSFVIDDRSGPREAWIDQPRLLQVFANLFANAVKFTHPGGTITVSLDRVAGELRFCVADTGSGISAEQTLRVFDRFWKAGGRDRRGLGLGLYICKAIVEAHAGHIWVTSELGVGSKFYFTLPEIPLDLD